MLLRHAFFILFIPLTCCLNLLELRIPEVADVREEAVLSCLYDLGGDKLYSVKWYKEELEFYRFMPDNHPQVQTFPVEGIHVVENKSNVTVITLSPLEYRSSGIYKCEVSSERPHFKTVVRSANMTVLALPKAEPRIDGIREIYLLGDYVEGNCTSSPSYPLAEVQWLINDRKAKDWFVEPYKPVKTRDSLGLEYHSLGLRFQIDMNHYQERSQVLTLTCQETLAGRTKSRVATIHLSRLLTNQKFAQEQLNRGGVTTIAKQLTVLAVLLLISL
ncbi:UNVERIFIED_CONTAM: hypothetical protein PYX00_007621 [Menopon gallinae]|uniref:Ig-like domain-containing protein n=1 Tax=Menopon gallinae TaxID=328185 RepID=A0AAW2HKE0_9NEOP